MAAAQQAITNPPEVQRLMGRYVNAYRVGRLIVRLGNIVKYTGVGIAVLILLGALLYVGNLNAAYQRIQQIQALVVAAFGAAMIWGISFIVGVLVCSKGELLKATLDEAVNTSPFLENQDRKKIMSL
jgi:hypothetical protein